MSRHVNIPIFIPHLGCPNQCVFCNQRTISGVKSFNPDDVDRIIRESLSTVEKNAEVEIAFFGGSFTGIDRQLMTDLLDRAYEYVKRGLVQSIRCSTRPDYIDEEVLTILGERGVRVIELGLQSSSDSVLALCKRGHDRECEVRACRMIVEHGFTLVGQMMIGLPGSTSMSELECAEMIISLGAKAARIYPTVVFRDTELCSMAQAGEYRALTIDEAVERSARVFDAFIKNGVEVIRIGLCASDNLGDPSTYYSGPNHPALGEMVINKYYLDKIRLEADKIPPSDRHILKVKVPTGHISKAVGQNKRNKLLLARLSGVLEVRFTECDQLKPFEVAVSGDAGELKCI